MLCTQHIIWWVWGALPAQQHHNTTAPLYVLSVMPAKTNSMRIQAVQSCLYSPMHTAAAADRTYQTRLVHTVICMHVGGGGVGGGGAGAGAQH